MTYETSDCGGIARGPLSTISSPGFPSLYPSNVDCAWLLEFDEGQQIEVNHFVTGGNQLPKTLDVFRT